MRCSTAQCETLLRRSIYVSLCFHIHLLHFPLPLLFPLSFVPSSLHVSLFLPPSIPSPPLPSLPPSLPPSLLPKRCRQHLEKKHRRRPPPVILHQNQRLNNQSDTSAIKPLHDLKGGGVRVQEIHPETTPHQHNGSASSGFVEELEHYAHTSFNGELSHDTCITVT